MSQLQRHSGVTMPSVRRYWYNTRDGKAEGDPLLEVNLAVLDAIARALGVESRDLLEPRESTRRDMEKEGNSRPAALAA